MKFAALVLLLAVGSQAASLQADAPNQLSQMKTKLKEAADRILAPLDSTPYKQNKDSVLEQADLRLGQMIEMGESLYSTASDATSGFRDTLKKDMQQLQESLTDDTEKVKENILNHLQEYVRALEPLKDHLEKKKPELEELKTKVTTIAEQIGEKVPKNWEETRNSLIPVVEKVKQHLSARGMELKKQIEPYVNDYRESVQAYMENPADKATPLFEEIKAKMAAYFATLSEALKN